MNTGAGQEGRIGKREREKTGEKEGREGGGRRERGTEEEEEEGSLLEAVCS